MKQLIVNADDFGFTRDVNEGIIAAHREGILTSATIMANGSEFHHAALLSHDHPTLGVGAHLTLVGERALSRPGKALPPTVAGLVAAIAAGSLDIDKEMEAQMKRILSAGLKPTHLDTHKHTHAHPTVFRAVVRLAERHGIQWIRRTLPAAMSIPVLSGWTARVLSRHHCRSADRFLGFRETGRLDAPALAAILGDLLPGITEFMCHPGFCGAELRAARTRLKESRQRELEALCSTEARAAVARSGVVLCSYATVSR